MNHSSISIDLQHVVKQFIKAKEAVPALATISAQIKRGTITGLVGADGSGKTTLLRSIAGLLSLTDGRILVEGCDAATDGEHLRTIIGYMPQKFGLYEDLSVLENLVLYADLRGIKNQDRKPLFEQLLHFTDLKRFTARRAGNLSGGMKQKLGLACALIGQPKVLLLDEPSVGVDPISRRELWKMVNTLVSEGMTVIWSTAYLYEAELCNEVLVLSEGKLLYSGEPSLLTQKMSGRSIQVQHIEGNHRDVLKNALRTKEVIDAVIQGSSVRLVLKKRDAYPDISALYAGPRAKFVEVKPRFEDAFMDLLGGVPSESRTLNILPKPSEKRFQNDIVIEAKNLTKHFGDFVAADNVSFSVKRGDIFCLLGPNGAGKSTVFKMMCGLLLSTSGSAKILDLDLKIHLAKARQQLGYMAQNFSLYRDLTVRRNLEFYSGIYGLTDKNQTDIMAKMVKIFDLESFLETKTEELPLGFKQRLSLACAIMHKPAILFLDEPTSGVDPIARRFFWSHINELAESGVTVVITTHFLDEAEYCNHIGLIYRGKLIATGTPDELKKQALTEALPDSSMEDAFIELINQHDKAHPSSSVASKQSTVDIKSKGYFAENDFIRRTSALCIKEMYQIVRDPSSILMAFILPMALLFIFGFGINLDTAKIKLGIVMNDLSSEARRFETSFAYSPYIDAMPMDLQTAKDDLTAGKILGFVMIQSDFSKRLNERNGIAPVEVFTDGSMPNTANFVIGYAAGAWQTWLSLRGLENAKSFLNTINIEQRYWFNPAAISRQFLVPGSIVLVMTIIGALLTSLVVAREWERGTMEALLSTPITRLEFIFSKLLPYYLLGIIAMIVCTITATTVLGAPFRGSFFFLFIVTTLFLGSVLGLGLLLSTTIRNQFIAAQAALNIAYLPAVMLSGFVYEISSMPPVIQSITYIFPARYFVSSLQTLFLAGNLNGILLKNAMFLLVTSVILLFLTYRFTRQKLD